MTEAFCPRVVATYTLTCTGWQPALALLAQLPAIGNPAFLSPENVLRAWMSPCVCKSTFNFITSLGLHFFISKTEASGATLDAMPSTQHYSTREGTALGRHQGQKDNTDMPSPKKASNRVASQMAVHHVSSWHTGHPLTPMSRRGPWAYRGGQGKQHRKVAGPGGGGCYEQACGPRLNICGGCERSGGSQGSKLML